MRKITSRFRVAVHIEECQMIAIVFAGYGSPNEEGNPEFTVRTAE